MAAIQTTSEPAIAEETDICKLCLASSAKYTCPRCNVRYCCAQCYKSPTHAQCSEAFYRDCFMQGLQDLQTNSEDKQKILEVLQRVEQDKPTLALGEDEEDSDDDLAERLQGIDLDEDSQQIWQRLTEKERKEFNSMLMDGRIGNMIELWQPWWTVKQELVEDVSSTSDDCQQPQILKSVPEFCKLMPDVQPSKTLPYNVINALLSYAYVMRLHNGEIADVPVQSASEILQLSDSLHQGTFPQTSEAIHSVLHSLQGKSRSLFVTAEFSVAVLHDLQLILTGPSASKPLAFVMSALSDLHRLFETARKCCSKDLQKASSSERRTELLGDKRLFYSVQKKLEFYLSWSQKFGLCVEGLVGEVAVEFCSLSTEIRSHQLATEKLECAWEGKQPPKTKQLIEEISAR